MITDASAIDRSTVIFFIAIALAFLLAAPAIAFAVSNRLRWNELGTRPGAGVKRRSRWSVVSVLSFSRPRAGLACLACISEDTLHIRSLLPFPFFPARSIPLSLVQVSLLGANEVDLTVKSSNAHIIIRGGFARDLMSSVGAKRTLMASDEP